MVGQATRRRPPHRVLVIGDHTPRAQGLVLALQDDGYDVSACRADGTQRAAMEVHRPDLVLLDAHLGDDDDPFAIGRGIRASGDLAIVYVTSGASDRQRVAAFEAGADDLLVEPYSEGELLVRIAAVLRRTNPHGRAVWRVGPVVVDEEAHTARLNGERLELTPLEFALLADLCRRPGRVISKEQLLSDVWGYDHYALNVVEVHVSSLRRKLELHHPRLIHTVRGVGYVARG